MTLEDTDARTRTVFLSSPELWQHGHGKAHPLRPERLARTHQLLEEYGAFAEHRSCRVERPRSATLDELLLFHTERYVSAVRDLSDGRRIRDAARYNFGPGDNPIFPKMFESESLKVGSAIVAAELLESKACDTAFSFAGGYHHGAADRASGFCVFNDAAVAIKLLVGKGHRVAYVDIDVHHGDGVQNAFYDTDQVLTIDLHQDGRTLFPGSGAVGEVGEGRGLGCCINLPLPPGTTDGAYLWAFEQIVPAAIERFAPDIVVTQLGVDTHYLDPLAALNLTTQGFQRVVRVLAQCSKRWLAFGGGGYDVSVVPRAWTLALEIMTGRSFSDELPPAYRAAFGGVSLRDDFVAPESTALTRQIRDRVNEVRRVHRLD